MLLRIAEQQGARERSGHGAAAAHQAGAADYHRRDRVELVADAVVRAALVELAGVDDPGQGGEEAGRSRTPRP